MKLYYYVCAPYSRKALIAAYEKEIDLEWVLVRPFEAGAMVRMRAETKQPLAQIPLLELDDGTFIRESSVIIEYFDLLRRDRPLLIPDDRAQALPVRMIDRFTDGMMGAASYLSWALRKSQEKQNHGKIEASRAQFWMSLAMLEPDAGKHTYLCGEEFTLADISVSCAIAEMIQFWGKITDLAPYPNLLRWYERTQERPSWILAHEESHRIHDESKIPSQD